MQGEPRWTSSPGAASSRSLSSPSVSGASRARRAWATALALGAQAWGATVDRDLFDWFQDVAATASGLGLTGVGYKRSLDIVQQDRDGTTLRRWSLSRAWPVKFVAGEWDNKSDENVIESVTLPYDFFELVQ